MKKLKLIPLLLISSLMTVGCNNNTNNSSTISSTAKPNNVLSIDFTEEDVDPYTCAHSFNLFEENTGYRTLKCDYCKAKCLSQPFSQSGEKIKLKKGETYTWAFNIPKQITASIYFYGAVDGNDLNGSFFSNNVLSYPTSEDTFELNPDNNGTPRVKLLVNDSEVAITTLSYRELGIYSGSYYYKFADSIQFKEGENIVKLITHDELRYHVEHSEDIRIIYIEND